MHRTITLCLIVGFVLCAHTAILSAQPPRGKPSAKGGTEKSSEKWFDFGWLEERLQKSGIDALMEGFPDTGADSDLATLKHALELSRHVLRQDKRQLWPQLRARTQSADSKKIDAMLSRRPTEIVLTSRHPTLQQAGGAMAKQLPGHTGPIMCIAISPDGKTIVSGSGQGDSSVRVWDFASGRQLRAQEERAFQFHSVAVTPDGKKIVAGTSDKKIHVWERASGRRVKSWEGHSRDVTAVAITPDSRTLVSASRDNTLKVWELASGRELHTLKGHSDQVQRVAITLDGKKIVSAGRDKTLRIWDTATGRELRSIDLVQKVDALAVTPHGHAIVAESARRLDTGYTLVKIWDITAGRVVRELKGHTGVVTGIASTPDGKRVVSVSSDETLKVWDMDSGKQLRSLGAPGEVAALALTPDGNFAVTGGGDVFSGPHTLQIWDLSSKSAANHRHHAGEVWSVAITPDGETAISGALGHDRNESNIKTWNMATGRERSKLPKVSRITYSLAVSSDGRTLVSGNFDTATVWDLANGREVRTLPGLFSSVSAVAMTPDGRTMIAVDGSTGDKIKFFAADTGKRIRELKGHRRGIQALAVTRDGKSLVSASWDYTVRVWDLTAGRELHTLKGHEGEIHAVSVSPDGKTIVSASDDDMLKVWNLKTGKELRTLKGHANDVRGVAVAADGRTVVSASFDATLRVWDLNSGKEVQVFTGDAPFRCVTILRDAVVAGDTRGRVHFFQLATPAADSRESPE